MNKILLIRVLLAGLTLLSVDLLQADGPPPPGIPAENGIPQDVGLNNAANPSKKSKLGGALPVVKWQPKIFTSPVMRQSVMLSETQLNNILIFLNRHSLITEKEFQGAGYVLSHVDGRLVSANGDRLAIVYNEPVLPGEILAVYRNTDTLHDPPKQQGVINHSEEEGEYQRSDRAPPISLMKANYDTVGQEIGRMLEHLALIRVYQINEEGILAEVITTFDAIQPGDRITKPRPFNADFKIHTEVPQPLQGRVVLSQNNLNELGSEQLGVVNLGRKENITQGTVLSILRHARRINDPITDEKGQIPRFKIGEAVVFYVGEQASFVLFSSTQEAVQVGDEVISEP